MPNLITGLKYTPSKYIPDFTPHTEEQIITIFEDLKQYYEKFTSEVYQDFSSNFKITALGNPVNSFRQFLNLAVKGVSVVLTGSGNIGGMTVKNGSLEYDLSTVAKITQYWDINRDGSCHSCHKHFYENVGYMEDIHACKIKTIGHRKDWKVECPEYDSKLKNFQGETARTLAEIMDEACEVIGHIEGHPSEQYLEYKLPNGQMVKEGTKIRSIKDNDSIYEVYYNGTHFCFRTHPYTGDFPADYSLQTYADRVELCPTGIEKD